MSVKNTTSNTEYIKFKSKLQENNIDQTSLRKTFDSNMLNLGITLLIMSIFLFIIGIIIIVYVCKILNIISILLSLTVSTKLYEL